MNLDDLRSVRASERKTDSLQHLRDSFYEDVGGYIADLQRRRNEAADAAADPFASEEVRRLTHEIETATEVAEAIYERRMGKLVKHASLVAAGMAADEEGMTAEERQLFSDIVERIEANTDEVLSVLSGDGVEESPTGIEDDEQAVGTAAAMGGAGDDGSREASSDGPVPEASDRATVDVGNDGGEEDGTAEPPATPGSDPGSGESDPDRTDEGSASDHASGEEGRGAVSDPDEDPPAGDTERLTVRITADVGEILGVDDRSYELQSEDVVALPAANARPLVERDAAEPLE